VNLNEFKAWFEGFCENIEHLPGERQWKRVVEKVGKIEDAPPATLHHFHDYYYRPWQRWFISGPYCVGDQFIGSLSNSPATIMQAQSLGSAVDTSALTGSVSVQDGSVETFDSSAAFRELGRAEFRSIR
jgi:hypothetical protein